MSQTKLGISIGLMAALTYLLCFFSNYTTIIILIGYIFLCEENKWLKKTAFKSFTITVCFSLLFIFTGIFPQILNMFNNFFNILNIGFNLTKINQLHIAIDGVLSIVKTILFILLGFFAINQKTIPIPPIDNFVDKHIE